MNARIKVNGKAALKLFQPPAGVKPPRRKKEKPLLEPPGTTICEFAVEGDPIPWRAPVVFQKIARTPPHVKAWKEHIALAANTAGYGEAAGVPPYGGPVRVELLFFRKCPVKKRWGTRWAARPDLDNLVKGFVDSLTGNVFRTLPKRKKREPKVSLASVPPSPVGRVLVDDNQVVELKASKWYGPVSEVVIVITAVEPARHPGTWALIRARHGEGRNVSRRIRLDRDQADCIPRDAAVVSRADGRSPGDSPFDPSGDRA